MSTACDIAARAIDPLTFAWLTTLIAVGLVAAVVLGWDAIDRRRAR